MGQYNDKCCRETPGESAGESTKLIGDPEKAENDRKANIQKDNMALEEGSKVIKLEPNVFSSFWLGCVQLDKTYPENNAEEDWLQNRTGLVKLRLTVHVVAMFALVVIALGMQFIFTNFMIAAIAQDEYKEKYNIDKIPGVKSTSNNLFEFWRAHKGGRDTFQKPWAHWACKGQDWSWEESRLDDMAKYNAGFTEGQFVPLVLTGVTKGQLFGAAAIALWVTSIVQALRSVASFYMLAFTITIQPEEVRRDLWVNPLLTGSVFLIVIARAALICYLGYKGCLFLAYTDNLKDFILNSVALGFVVSIPEVLFAAYASNVDKDAIDDFNDNMKPKTKAKWLPCLTLVWELSGIIALILGVALTVQGVAPLVQFSEAYNTKSYKQLCAVTAGNTKQIFQPEVTETTVTTTPASFFVAPIGYKKVGNGACRGRREEELPSYSGYVTSVTSCASHCNVLQSCLGFTYSVANVSTGNFSTPLATSTCALQYAQRFGNENRLPGFQWPRDGEVSSNSSGAIENIAPKNGTVCHRKEAYYEIGDQNTNWCKSDFTRQIDEAGTCKTASEILGITYGGNDTAADFPKGCYQYAPPRGAVYFNDNETGSPNKEAKPICFKAVVETKWADLNYIQRKKAESIGFNKTVWEKRTEFEVLVPSVKFPSWNVNKRWDEIKKSTDGDAIVGVLMEIGFTAKLWDTQNGFFQAPYELAELGSNQCPDGASKVWYEHSCRRIAIENGKSWGGPDYENSYPGGCYLLGEYVYLNAAYGSANAESTPICEKGNQALGPTARPAPAPAPIAPGTTPLATPTPAPTPAPMAAGTTTPLAPSD